MKTGRNDPCPCGSGKKYKRCCLPLEENSPQGALGAEMRAAASAVDLWQMDLVPVPVALDDDPAARPAVAMIMGGGAILHAEMLSRPPAAAAEVAAELARQLALAEERLEVRPATVEVGHAALAEELAELLPDRIVVQAGPLLELRSAAAELRAQMSGGEVRRSFACSPITWAGWGLGEAWCERLFAAAAGFFRAAPWRHLNDCQVLELTGPSGDRWLASVLGRGGMEYGIALYGDDDDVTATFAEATADTDAIFGPVISLLFAPVSELERPLRKEVARAGWEVASTEAYPTILTLNTLAGGIEPHTAEDLVAFLRGVPRFVEERRSELERRELPDELVDREAGVRIAAGQPRLWALAPPPVGPLRPGFAEGDTADPTAVDESAYEDPDGFLERELEVVSRFEATLEDEGLSDKTIAKHVDNAETFVHYMAFHLSVPLVALHEYHLRFFLYDWYPRKVITSRTIAATLPGSLRRFLRYLAETEGIVLPAAKEVLRERKLFLERWESFPGGHWWDAEVADWCYESHLDLDARVMLHDDRLGDDDEWGATMGMVEAELERKLARRWLLWRDGLLRDGIDDPEELREQLQVLQHGWETRPHPDLEGKTPVEAIAAERQATQSRFE